MPLQTSLSLVFSPHSAFSTGHISQLPFVLLLKFASGSSLDAGLALPCHPNLWRSFNSNNSCLYMRSQEGWSDGPNITQGVRSRQDWSGAHLTLLNVLASKRPLSPHSHMPTCSGNNTGAYDLLSQPFCFVPLLLPWYLNQPLLNASFIPAWAVFVPFLLSYMHAAWYIRHRQYMFTEGMSEWVAFYFGVELPRIGLFFHHLDKPHSHCKSKLKTSSSWTFWMILALSKHSILLILPSV